MAYLKLAYGNVVKPKGKRFWLDVVTPRPGTTRNTVKGTLQAGQGRMFATKRAFREWSQRALFGDWQTNAPVTPSARILRQSQVGTRLDVNAPSDNVLVGLPRRSDDPGNDVRLVRATPTKPNTKASGVALHVRNVNGIWRRYHWKGTKALPNGQDHWQSDHATMSDALAGVNALADPLANVDRSHVVNVSSEEATNYGVA